MSAAITTDHFEKNIEEQFVLIIKFDLVMLRCNIIFEFSYIIIIIIY